MAANLSFLSPHNFDHLCVSECTGSLLLDWNPEGRHCALAVSAVTSELGKERSWHKPGECIKEGTRLCRDTETEWDKGHRLGKSP